MNPFSALRSATMGALLAVATLLGSPPSFAQTAYEAPLPAQINTDPDLCAHVACTEVLPAA
ncbi:MAG TPA: hypothetical protein PLZ11_12105, partial [Thauera sp.]|nr:hypothetical protein [Thauera sp.]